MIETTTRYYTTEGSKSWCEYVLSHKSDYASKYTRLIYEPYAFSSSVLAFSVEKCINMKLGKQEPITRRAGVLLGDAVHDYLQSRLSDKYGVNIEIQYRIPFKWKSLTSSEIIVICHPDILSLFEKQIVELKTSVGKNANGVIKDYMRRQVALYWRAVKDQNYIDCDARVVKLWSDENMEELNIAEDTLLPHQKTLYSDEMIIRAKEAATALDAIYKADPSLIQPKKQ